MLYKSTPLDSVGDYTSALPVAWQSDICGITFVVTRRVGSVTRRGV